MTTVIALPNEQTATFLDGDQLTNKQVKILRRAARKVGLVGQHLKDLGMDDLRAETPEGEDAPDADAADETNKKALEILSHLTDEEDDTLDLFQRVCVVVRLESWTLDRALPATAEDVDDLPRPIYATLTTEAAKLDLSEDFSMEGATDPKAPTEDSDNSEPPSEAVS